MRKSLIIFALVLSAPVLAAQSYIKVVPSESDSIVVSFPIASTVRWCDVATGLVCSPPESVPANTTFVAYCPRFADCATADSTDGLSAITKDLEVLQQSVDNPVSVNGSIVHVPAFAPPSIVFTPGVSTNVAVSNIPPPAVGQPTTPATGLQYLMTLRQGNTTIQLVCTYFTTTADGSSPPQLAAVFTCVPVTQ